jgi:hypothetical protein
LKPFRSHFAGIKINGRQLHASTSPFFDYALPALYVKHFFETGAVKKLHICNHHARIYDNIVFSEFLLKLFLFFNSPEYWFIIYFLDSGTQVAKYYLKIYQCMFNLSSGGYSNAR